MIEFRVLGSFEVVDLDGPLPLGGPKQRAVLAVLLLHRGEPVSTDRLIDEIWGEHPPASANKLVQGYVSNLRKTLGDGLLVTQGRGYCLRTEPGQTDVDRFEALESDGRRALARGDLLTAAAVLRDALAVWRGPALADFAYEPFAQAEIVRLEEARLAALQDRIDADLALGEHARLVGELEVLVREHPLRERFRGQLMLALYRSGRQSDALAAYGRAREVLSDQLGLEPGAPLRELQLAILNHDASLDMPRPAAGNALAACSAGEPEVSAATRGRLPVRGPLVFGRERELGKLQALLIDSSVALLTLTGAGGSGKTTLALEAARRAEASFSDGVTVVWLAGLSDASQVVFELARALGVEVSSHEPAIDTLAQVLRFQERLLVLDNFEHVIAAAPLLARLASGCSGLKLLVTSRAPLHVNLEQVYRVEGLAALEPGEGGASLDSLRHWPASALFLERARTANPGYQFREGDSAAVAELCAYLGGLPLALELAAASAALLSSGEILKSLHSSRLGLGLPRRDAPDRQQTIRATVDWSLSLLGAGEQRLFGRLGVFVGGFTIEAAEAVGEDLGLSIVEGLATLLDHGLIYRQKSRPISRLWMLEPIRDYARERLNTDPERERATRTHTEYYTTLAEAAQEELTSGDQLACLERLDDEQANIRSALDRASAQSEIDTALRIAHALGDYFFIRGLVAERRPWLAWALDQPRGDPAIRARALLDLGWLAAEDGEYEQAASALAESLALCEQMRDVRLIAQCEAHIALNEWYRGRGDGAAVFAQRGLTTAARAGDPNTEAIVLLLTAHCARSYEDAQERSRRALEIFESVADRIWPPRIKANLAKQARRAGDHENARLLIDEVMSDPASVWGAGFRAQTERELGLIELSEGHRAVAREHLSASLTLDRSIGDRRDTQDVLIGLAALDVVEGAPDNARALLAAALAIRDGPVDVRASLQGCRLTESQLSEMASIAAHATRMLPRTPAQLETILRNASDNRQPPAVEPTHAL